MQPKVLMAFCDECADAQHRCTPESCLPRQEVLQPENHCVRQDSCSRSSGLCSRQHHQRIQRIIWSKSLLHRTGQTNSITPWRLSP